MSMAGREHLTRWSQALHTFLEGLKIDRISLFSSHFTQLYSVDVG